MQEQEHVVPYFHQSLSRTQRKYSVTKEMLDVFKSLGHLHHCLYGAIPTVCNSLNSLKNTEGQLASRIIKMDQYSYIQ